MRRTSIALTLGAFCALLAVPCAHAGPITITLDGFASGSNLDGNGITAQGPAPSSATATDTGLASIFGGDRLTTLNLTNGGANSKVNVKISGGSAKVEYKSSNGNVIADGQFDFLYNGSSEFPHDFSNATNIEIDVFNQNNPVASTLFSITLTDTEGDSSTQTAPALVGNSNGATILFPFSGFPTPIDLTQITSIDVIINPSADTNLQLDGLFIHDNTPNLPPPPPFTTTVPEPGSLALVVIGGAVLGAWRLRRRSKSLQTAP
jgi:hypothetical protein